MLSIKLKPVGKKHQRSFRIVASEKKSKLTGRFVEDLGWYNPHFGESEVKKERVEYWLGQGAQPTDSVYNILVRKGMIKGPKRPVHKKAKKKEEESSGAEDKKVKEKTGPESKEESGEKEEKKEIPVVPSDEEAEKEEVSSQESEKGPEKEKIEGKEEKEKSSGAKNNPENEENGS